MTIPTKARILIGLTVIFAAGAVAGAALSQRTPRRGPPPSPEQICRFMREKLSKELELTPQQLDRLDPLLDKQRQRMEEIHKRSVTDFDQLRRDSNAEIAAVLQLTPEQRAKFEAMEKRRAEFMKNHGDKRGRSKSPPPPAPSQP